MLEKEVEIGEFENCKGLTYTDLVEFLKFLNRKDVKIENFNPQKLIKEVSKDKIIFTEKIYEEPYRKFIDLLEERNMI
jgi:hypothetical protein